MTTERQHAVDAAWELPAEQRVALAQLARTSLEQVTDRETYLRIRSH